VVAGGSRGGGRDVTCRRRPASFAGLAAGRQGPGGGLSSGGSPDWGRGVLADEADEAHRHRQTTGVCWLGGRGARRGVWTVVATEVGLPVRRGVYSITVAKQGAAVAHRPISGADGVGFSPFPEAGGLRSSAPSTAASAPHRTRSSDSSCSVQELLPTALPDRTRSARPPSPPQNLHPPIPP